MNPPEMNILKNNILVVDNINYIIDYYISLKNLNHDIIIVSDIDNTILSEKIGQTFVENNIKKLCKMVYDDNPNNLIFLTAREYCLKRKTINKLNAVKLIRTGYYKEYNVICSPDDINNNETKGQTLVDYINSSRIIINENSWIIFIDDLIEQIENVNLHLKKLNIKYTLFHYNHT